MTQDIKSKLAGINRLFLITVVLPTLLAIIYFGFIASDVYISESCFIVRVPDRQSTAPLGFLMKGFGFSRSQDDSYTVQDYILSRDALRALDEKLKVGEKFSSDSIDHLNRFAGIDGDDSFEALYDYYQDRIEVLLDSSSSITTLTVRAFTSEDAYQINEHLLYLGETLINQLNERGRRDMITFATQEVEAAEQKATAAAMTLAAYSNEKGIVDPEAQSAIQLQQVAKLQDELIAAKAQLTQLQAFTKDNPRIPVVKKQIRTLQQEIRQETMKVAGGSKSLANKASKYQRLLLELEFANTQLASAMASLEQARNEVLRKQLYLELIVRPNKPDVALEPKRIRGIIATLVLGLIAWGIVSLFVAGAKEHSD